MPSSFDLNDIRVFAVVAETGSMSAAAKQIGVPISTVSRSVARLEQRLAVALIQRVRRGIVLTDAGREYLPSCKEAIQLLEVSAQNVAIWKASPSGTIKVRCPATMAWSVLSPLMTRWRASYPSLQVELLPFFPSSGPLPTEEVDIIFSTFPPDSQSRAIRSYPAGRRGIYASPEYAQKCGLPHCPEELHEHHCIGSRDSGFAKWVLSNGQNTVTLEIAFQTLVGDPAMLKQLILDGIGISMLPIWMARHPDTRELVVEVLPGWTPSSVGLYATYSARPAALPQVLLFLDFLSPYLGTERDPRLQGLLKPEECFEIVDPRGAQQV